MRYYLTISTKDCISARIKDTCISIVAEISERYSLWTSNSMIELRQEEYFRLVGALTKQLGCTIEPLGSIHPYRFNYALKDIAKAKKHKIFS